MDEQQEKLRPIDVAKRWNIPHIIDVNDGTAVSKWQETFIALAQATIALRESEKRVNNMAIILSNSVTEITVYERALKFACSKANIDPDELLQKILEEIKDEHPQ